MPFWIIPAEEDLINVRAKRDLIKGIWNLSLLAPIARLLTGDDLSRAFCGPALRYRDPETGSIRLIAVHPSEIVGGEELPNGAWRNVQSIEITTNTWPYARNIWRAAGRQPATPPMRFVPSRPVCGTPVGLIAATAAVAGAGALALGYAGVKAYRYLHGG